MADDRTALDRSFESARQGSRTADWLVVNQTASADLKASMPLLTARGQDLSDNNSFSAGAIAALVNNAVGVGITGDPVKASKTYREAFADWSGSLRCDFYESNSLYGLQELIMRSFYTRGSVLIRRRYQPENVSYGLNPLQLQVLEADQLDTNKDDTQRTIGGKQYDVQGRLEGFWLKRVAHIADPWNSTYESEFVPRSEMIHFYRHYRPNAYTGLPAGHAGGVLRARDIDDCNFAELLKQKIAACMVGVRTTADDSLTSPDDEGTYDDPATLKPGAIYRSRPGESWEFSDPPKVDSYKDFQEKNLRALATSYGVMAEHVTSDYSQSNYTSLRMSRLEFNRRISMDQELLIAQVLNRVAEWYIQADAIVSGGRRRQPRKIHWQPPKVELVDPPREIPATIEAIRGGLSTLRREQRKFGLNPDDALDEMQQMNEEMDSRGIKLDTDIRQSQAAVRSSSPPSGDNDETDGDGGQNDAGNS